LSDEVTDKGVCPGGVIRGVVRRLITGTFVRVGLAPGGLSDGVCLGVLIPCGKRERVWETLLTLAGDVGWDSMQSSPNYFDHLFHLQQQGDERGRHIGQLMIACIDATVNVEI